MRPRKSCTPSGVRSPGILSQLPAVLALHRSQQASQIGPNPPARLEPAKARRNLFHQCIQPAAQSTASSSTAMAMPPWRPSLSLAIPAVVLGGARRRVISNRMSANICHGTAISASCKRDVLAVTDDLRADLDQFLAQAGQQPYPLPSASPAKATPSSALRPRKPANSLTGV